MRVDSNKDNELQNFEIQRFVRAILRQKFIVIGFVVLGAALAVSYAFLASPVYEAKVFIMPPSQSDISNFNYGRMKESELVPYTVKDVYDIYTRSLQAESLRLDFFSKVYVPSLSPEEQKKSRDVLYSNFSAVLRVVPPLRESSDRYAVVVQATHPEKAKEWATEYVAQAGELAKNEMIKNVSIESEVRARNLEQQISSAREKSTKAREDSIVRLNEALRIADSIGLEKPPAITVSQSVIAGGEAGQLTYMRGSKALKAEIESLQARESDDPFTDRLRDLQDRFNFFKGLKTEPALVSVYRQDGVVELPDNPVKPNKTLVLVFGVIAGLIAGIAFVLFRGLFAVKPD
ncbi:chain-length determining protein [Pseudomonas jessenii]|jgi:chain length determinant protein (polysaccharide antigen chain regulator)|uniref:Chain-length determining protein n=1 Tax=Pseudomonas jessenii TaxID=77298 RepID=A0A2W0EUP0_PSEJE|nr:MULTISPECIES: Wzz/FepE/Etk N-terminal domain-containing protein [Pseudomonas]PYY71626.1 chain-length determining protein [Pseudomonas jessenii]WPN28696.1 Wzz/FepE/Etk N-terminal domain-containing protein [Pseudomonas sp. P5_109]